MTIRELEQLYISTTPKTLTEFLVAIRVARAQSQVQTINVIDMLDAIIDGFMPEGRMMCDNLDLMSDEHLEYLQMHAKIVAAQMVLLFETRSNRRLSSRALLFLEYSAHLITKGGYDFSKKAIEAICYPYKTLGYSWSNVEHAPYLTTITHQFVTMSAPNRNEPFDKFTFAALGQLSAGNGRISLKSSHVTDGGSVAFSVCDGALEIVTRNTRDERLKTSDASQVEKLEEFSKTFVKAQKEFSSSKPGPQIRPLVVGQKYNLQCVGLSDDESSLLCCPIDVSTPCHGYIINEQLTKGIYTEDIINYILNDDCIKGAELVEMGQVPLFSIKDSYASFSRQSADKDFRNNTQFEAMVIAINPDINRVNWITSGGYGAISVGIGDYKVGDIDTLEVMNVQTTSSSMFINVRPPRCGVKGSVRRFDEDEVLVGFVCGLDEARKDFETVEIEVPQANAEQISKVRNLARILAHNLVGNSLENYRRLLVSQFLSELIEYRNYVLYPKSRAGFLANCIALAQKKQLHGWNEDMSPLLEERLILRALGCYFSPEDTMSISQLLTECRPGTKPYFVAQHVLARSLSVHIPDEVRCSSEEFRRRICEELGVVDMFTSSGDSVPGKYGFAEMDNIEFKSSYVMRNDGKGADIDRQGRGEVFQAVCGFLNKNGGTVYLGVNNSGDPLIGANVGLNADMKWLSDNYMYILEKRKRQLGHPVPKADTLDHMALFLNDEKELYFKETLHDNISISPTEDNDAIRITVTPARYEIAVLYTDKTRSHGTAFVRDGQETIPMTAVAQEQRLMDLRSVSQTICNELALQEAIDKKRKVILKDYASGSSGEVRDRLVVPINLFYNKENVYCYDLGSKDFRQFRISRIGSVESDIPDAEYPHTMTPRYADVFRWLGDDRFHVRLKMDLAARNYLLEDYSDAGNLSESEFYESGENEWILDTHLQGLIGLRRFFLGLADRIEILPTEDSDAVRKMIGEFLSKNLKEFLD